MQEVTSWGKLLRCDWALSKLLFGSSCLTAEGASSAWKLITCLMISEGNHLASGAFPPLKNLSDRLSAATNSHWKLPPCHKPIGALEHFFKFTAGGWSLELHLQYSWSTVERWQWRQLCWLCCQQSPPPPLVVTSFMFDVAIHRLLHCTFYWNVKC